MKETYGNDEIYGDYFGTISKKEAFELLEELGIETNSIGAISEDEANELLELLGVDLSDEKNKEENSEIQRTI